MVAACIAIALTLLMSYCIAVVVVLVLIGPVLAAVTAIFIPFVYLSAYALCSAAARADREMGRMFEARHKKER